MVGVNCFHGECDRSEEEVRAALDLDPSVPVLLRDVRQRGGAKDLLLALADVLLEQSEPAGAPTG